MSYPRNTKKEWKCFRLFHLFPQKLKLFQIVAARGWTDSVNITFVPFLNSGSEALIILHRVCCRAKRFCLMNLSTLSKVSLLMSSPLLNPNWADRWGRSALHR